MIYLDSSALLKLVRSESGSEALTAWLAAPGHTSLVTSELGRVEVVRAARRVGPAEVIQARTVMHAADLVPLGRDVLDLAAEIGDPGLRSPDAIHLASARLLGEALSAFVAYDRRLVAAADAAGLPVASVPSVGEGSAEG